MSNVKERGYIIAEIKLMEPLCVSSGINEYADNDIIRDFDGRPFIPASSIAGAIRNYVNNDKVFGDRVNGSNSNQTQRMSSVFISDFYFDDNVKTKIRNNVALDDEKIAKDTALFNMEVIEPDFSTNKQDGVMIFEYVQYDNNTADIVGALKQALCGIDAGDIRFGSKKNRGLGRMKILNVYSKKFTMPKDNDNWLDFNVHNYYKNNKTKEDLLDLSEVKVSSSFTTITVPLKLAGGISIREYAAKKNEPDYTHITSGGWPVVPGSSFAGAIRHQCKRNLELLGVEKEKIKDMLNEMFGYEDCSKQSEVVICESKLFDAKGSNKKPVCMKMTRNKIDRFDASTEKGALYTEKSVFNATTELVIKLRKSNEIDWKIGLLIIAIKDIQEGYLAIGGQTAIGRGIFSENGSYSVNGVTIKQEEENKFFKELAKKIS
ncbi:MAG: hypothetical protein K6G26_04755 [Lachnospiraceae bacterium]|nr:hypothetical protein [Lachnospiraceae bacterium]